MRIAICVKDADECDTLTRWVGQYCELYGASPEIVRFSDAEALFGEHAVCRFELVFLGISGPEGFLHARRFRELDKFCKVVYIEDTAEYAVRSVRLHFTDYIIRPVEFRKVVRAMKLAGV